ncbi:hypothetical protein ACFWVM_22115 [Nocardia fluminea]|uniref:hypothetical protein n=1 Tax=Nocardia fluminea TaxID=134984 RepID=UPI00365E0567
MREARMWAAGTAASPIVFPLVVIGVAAVVDVISGTGADVAWYLVFALMVGISAFLPGICVSLVGVALLPRRSGTVITVIALLLLMLAAGLMSAGIFDDALTGPDDNPRLIPKLSIPEAAAASVPYAFVIIAGLYAAFRVVAAARINGNQDKSSERPDKSSEPVVPQDRATPPSSG